MPHLSKQEKLQDLSSFEYQTDDNWLIEQRKVVTASLTDINTKVQTALDDAGLAIEVFFTVPSSGEALLHVATPVDPSGPGWTRVSQIICDTVGNIIGIEGLYSRCLPCTASSVPMTGADVSSRDDTPVGPPHVSAPDAE